MSGSGIPIVEDVGDFLGDTAEAVGDFVGDTAKTVGDFAGDTAEAVGDFVGDTFASFDKEVLQQVDIGTIATIGAIALAPVTGGASLTYIPYITAANTAIKGGKLEDIALSFAVSYAAAGVAPGVSEGVLGATGSAAASAVATGAVVGAGTSGVTAAVRGEDIGEAVLRGTVVGGVAGGVGYGVNQGYDAFRSEMGYGQSTPPPVQADADFVAAQAESLRAQPGGVSDQYMADVLTQEGVDSFVAQDVSRLTNQGIGEAAVSQNISSSYQPGEIYTPPPITDNALEKSGKKLAKDVISGSILNDIYGTNNSDSEDPMAFLTFRRRGKTLGTEMFDDAADTSLNLTQVQPDKFELRKYANAEGQSTLISFKDDKPQQPIPSGYEPVETIGAAEGGLISTNMVKYSKKPLLAKRKPDVQKKVTTRKGLAGKKS
jgi:hypothetical protein